LDIARIRREVTAAQAAFPNIELSPTTDGKLAVFAALQTSAGRIYTLSIGFPDGYPNSSPKIFLRKPAMNALSPHKYNDGSMCYMLPSLWNPARHDLTFAIAKAAKWLNKYDVWSVIGRWPGAQLQH